MTAVARRQNGRRHKLTEWEIARVRRFYRAWQAMLAERRALLGDYRLTRDEFCRIGKGIAGKKPRLEDEE